MKRKIFLCILAMAASALPFIYYCGFQAGGRMAPAFAPAESAAGQYILGFKTGEVENNLAVPVMF